MAQLVKNPPAVQETWGSIPGWEDPLDAVAGTQPAGMQGPYLPRSEMEEPGDHERDINDLLNSAGVPKSRPRTHRNQAEQQEISSDLPLPIPPTPLNHPRSPTPVHGKTVFQEISPRCQKGWGPLR